MLAAVSQPIVHSGYISQQNLSETNQQANDSKENTEQDIVTSETKKITQKATVELSQQDQQEISQLKQRDSEVKAHEQAHLSVAGGFAVGGASFTYQTGPNGIRYAVGGEVSISTSPVQGDPAATLKKADAIRRAALAPANPSTQDLKVAGRATSMAGKARVDLVKLSQELEQQKEEIKVTEKKDESSEGSQINNKAEMDSNKVTEPPPTLGSLLDISV